MMNLLVFDVKWQVYNFSQQIVVVCVDAQIDDQFQLKCFLPRLKVEMLYGFEKKARIKAFCGFVSNEHFV